MNTAVSVDESLKKQAICEIQEGSSTCILLKENKIIAREEGIGVSPLRRLYESEDGRQKMQGAFLSDKVIGKAAAVLAVLGQVNAVYGELTSKVALEYLSARGIPCSYNTLVDCIQNRSKTGLCPLEQAVLLLEDEKEAYQAMLRTIQELMRQNG